MTIEDIYKRGEINVRAYNVCRYNRLHFLSDLIQYHQENESFKNLQNCGEKTNNILISICKKYQENSTKSLPKTSEPEKGLMTKISSLTRTQREVINSFIFLNTSNLSVRSKKAFSLYLNNNFKVKNFVEKTILSKRMNLKDLKNIGVKSISELKVYIATIKDFISEVFQMENKKDIISLKIKFLIQRTYDISSIPNFILKSESIFSLTNFLLNRNAFFDETQTIIFENSLKLYHNQKVLTLAEISKQVNLTKERVRQIKKLCLNQLFNKLLFLSNFNDDLFQKYNIDVESDYLKIDSEVIERINKLNGTNFSKEFITYILYVYLEHNFALVGDFEDVLQSQLFNTRKRYNWNNLYLVNKKLALEIDFNSLTYDISKRINGRIPETYSFYFKSYLSKFLVNDKYDDLNLLSPIVEKVINAEFELYLDLHENIVFKRNTPRQVYEYAFEALEQLGKPSKVKEIFGKVMELYPNYDTDEEKIRASMKRKNGFVPISRKSMFGLKKWEKELENFKGGSIRGIVEEYLNQFSTPKHISDIAEYVLKYRPSSNQYSILQNLKLEKSGTYTFFEDSHIGLSYKRYKSSNTPLKIKTTKKQSWETRFEMLKDFIFSKHRLPLQSNVPESEKKLYRWISVQKTRDNKGILNQEKKEKLIRLLEECSDHKD